MLFLRHLLLAVILVNTVISQHVMKFAEYCPSVDDYGLSWPQTEAGSEAYPQEYCFKTDGFRLSRPCIADSVNGAHWADITDTCTIPANSSISQELFTLIGEYRNRTIWDYMFYDDVVNVSTQYSQFSAFDVYLAGTIMDFAFRLTTSVYVDQTIKVFDNILNIDDDVLEEAERKMRAAEPWLSTLQYMQNHIKVNNFNVVRTNFGFVTTQSQSAITGALVQHWGAARNISTVGYLVLLDDVLSAQNLDRAVWIEPPPESFSPKLGFVFYWNHGNALFFDESVPVEYVDTVVGVWAQAAVNPVQVIRKFDGSSSSQNVQCASWEQGNVTKGNWKFEGEFRIEKSCFICTFEGTGTFALIMTPAKSVGDVLNGILGSNATSVEAAEVALVGKIFRKMSSRKDVDFQLLNQVLYNLQKVDSQVFAKTALKENIAGYLAFSADVILQKYS